MEGSGRVGSGKEKVEAIAIAAVSAVSVREITGV